MVFDSFDNALVVAVDLYDSLGLEDDRVESNVLAEETYYRIHSVRFGLARVGIVISSWYVPLSAPERGARPYYPRACGLTIIVDCCIAD